MSDIVERLRDPSAFPDTVRADCAEAAAEIERLREQLELTRNYGMDEIERLRKENETLMGRLMWHLMEAEGSGMT